jgi:hypothetical protein
MSIEPEPKTPLTIEKVIEDGKEFDKVVPTLPIYRGNAAIEPVHLPEPGDPYQDAEEF